MKFDLDMIGAFFSMLAPWKFWNFLILFLGVIFFLILNKEYKKTKSRSLLTALPGLFTSLGILGTFGAICYSLAVISAEPDSMSNLGKPVKEAMSSTTGSLNIKRIISDLIPAFSTSIYGLIGAIWVTIHNKKKFAREDAELVGTLKYKDPEKALEALDEHVLSLISANEENNSKLTDSIAAQSKILDKFVNSFITEMQGCFTAMNTVIEERVTEFGTTQFAQSREILEKLTGKLSEDTLSLISSHNDSVKAFTETSTADMLAIKESLAAAVSELKTNTVSGIEELSRQQSGALQKLTEESIAFHTESVKAQDNFNQELLNKMSSSLEETATRIIKGTEAQISILQEALRQNIAQLNDSYGFITEKSASIVSNYEQAVEAYRDAVQNAHDLNERVEKGIGVIGSGLKDVTKTNENLGKVVSLIEEKETSMEAIVMRIEELGKAIATLQKLESALSRIAS